jgi:signal transduction histidine kinase
MKPPWPKALRGSRASSENGHPDTVDYLADLHSSFLKATKADRCVIKLVPEWRKIVGRWLGSSDLGAVPVSRIKVTQGSAKSEVRATLVLGRSPTAQIVVTSRKERGLAEILHALITFIPKVASRLCLEWLREEANAHEWRRLVQVLHDGPLQIATAAKVHLQAVRHGMVDSTAAKGLDVAIAHIGQVIIGMRTLLRERVPISGSDSLIGHLRLAAGRWGAMTGMRVHFNFSDDLPARVTAFSRETLEVAEQVVRESIINAWKHGKARQLSISCEPHNGGMLLTLQDDGTGFRATIAPKQGDGTKIGLRLLHSRVNELGGWFNVGRGQGGGAIVKTWLPPPPPSRDGSA